LLRAGAVAVLLVGVGVLLREAGPGILRTVRPTAAGGLLFIAAGAVLTAFGLPRQVVAFAGGYVFGAWEGSAIALVAQMLGCGADYVAARYFAGLGPRAWLARGRRAGALHRTLSLRPFSVTLTLRLLPVGNNLVVNLLAGVAGLPAVPFLLATLIGYVPQTLIFALLGSGAQVGRGVHLAMGAALFAAAAALGIYLYRSLDETRVAHQERK
jgi:uncharacterized membrane protein YdjX (TVP38/TMEM64 family)